MVGVTCAATLRSFTERTVFGPMRWSQLYAPTLRDDPADAEAVSHRLLVRGGFVRQLMAGHFSLLPLAVRVRSKIMDIVRESGLSTGAVYGRFRSKNDLLREAIVTASAGVARLGTEDVDRVGDLIAAGARRKADLEGLGRAIDGAALGGRHQGVGARDQRR